EAEQYQEEPECGDRLDQWLSGREGRPEDAAVEQGGHTAEEDAHEERDDLWHAPLQQRRTDQGTHGAYGAVGEVEHAGGAVEDDETDTRHGEHPPQGQAEDQVRLDRLQVRHRSACHPLLSPSDCSLARMASSGLLGMAAIEKQGSIWTML